MCVCAYLTPPISMSHRYERAAASTYRECLRLCPYAMEAWVALAELGLKLEEAKSILSHHFPASAKQVGTHVRVCVRARAREVVMEEEEGSRESLVCEPACE